MTFQPHGRHLIAGEWVASDASFASTPVSGSAHHFAVATPDDVDRACVAAEEAFWSYGYSAGTDRAAFLNTIADEIEARAGDITAIAAKETGLPEARLQGERGRTTSQLRLFAEHILKDDYLDLRHDVALPDRAPLPRPDLKMAQLPIGPVAVFGASNFPLAFSTAGGDTASALAAGCPVVVKGHPAHPGTGEIIAQAIHAAIKKCGVGPGTFSFLQGDTREMGQALVQHPLINAVGFTGSLGGGRALFDLCARRPVPIPFFGELGSVNPMFLLPEAMSARGGDIASGWAASLTIGAGQFCTNPGVVVVIDGPDADAFQMVAVDAIKVIAPQTMLTDDIAQAYRDGRDRMTSTSGVNELFSSVCAQRTATPSLLTSTGAQWLKNSGLREEVFGPLGLVIRAADEQELVKIAKSLEGQLTCTLHMNDGDIGLAKTLMPVLERKAGRIVTNGFPTGVEVSDTMVHGGPYPASTNFGATSVGTLAIRRFLRPLCYQNVPSGLLPDDFG